MVPKGWQLLKLAHILYLEYGKGLANRQRKIGIYPVLGSNGIIGYHNKSLIKGPGIVIGRKGTIGAINWIDSDFWPIDTTFYVKIIADVDLKWLFHSLNYLNLPKLGLSDVVPGLKRELVYGLKLLCPTLPEQKEIAEVLSTVDQAIEKVGEAIERTQRLKKGLMQELLTKGIGHKEFKITKIGKMPREWNTVVLSDIAKVRYGLGQPPSIDINGTPMIRATNIKNGQIYREGLIYINPKEVPPERNAHLHEGEIIVVRSGAYTGDIGLITKEWEGAVAGYDLILSPKGSVNSQFLVYYLLSPVIQRRYFSGLKVRSAQPHLNSSQVERTPIHLPPLSEQEEIAEILSSVDERIEALRSRKEKLEKVKKRLMEDLLTGRVRVIPLIEKET